MPADPQRVVNDLKELRSLTATEMGSQRLAWTDKWVEAREWFVTTFDGVPVTNEIDTWCLRRSNCARLTP
jgi:beta-ureidopropionase / N-carbamoyl-L-amino-acid hydrolase